MAFVLELEAIKAGVTKCVTLPRHAVPADRLNENSVALIDRDEKAADSGEPFLMVADSPKIFFKIFSAPLRSRPLPSAPGAVSHGLAPTKSSCERLSWL